MANIFTHRLKALIRNKELIFWLLLFPILLATLFNMAFSDMMDGNLISQIDIAVVDGNNAHVTSVLEEVRLNDDYLFNINHANYEDATELLQDGEVSGIIKISYNDEITLIVRIAGMEQAILHQFLNNYKQQTALIYSQLSLNPELMYSGWLEMIGNFENHVERLQISDASNDVLLIMFYTVIAMACLHGAYLAVTGMKNIGATTSKVGARVTLTPYPKLKLILADFMASTLLTLIAQSLLILFLVFVIGVNFTNNIGLILLIILIGSVFATSFGYLVALFTKSDGLLTAIVMTWSFMAGMMGPDFKVLFEEMVPFINYFNPVALITDSFFKLIYFNDFTMIIPYLAALVGWSVLCLALASIVLRRQQHDHI